MAYGQGMLLDSIRNVLNRRQQARAEDDQFQLAQDRGENAMERLKMQADMSVAQKQAADENAILKEYIRANAKRDVANIGAGASKYGADQGIERARVTGEGFNKSAKTRGEYDLAGRGVTAQSMIERQRLSDEAKLARQDNQQGFLGPEWEQNRKSSEREAWIRANASENNTRAIVSGRAAASDPVLRSLDAEIGKIQDMHSRMWQAKINGMDADLRSQREAVQAAAAEVASEMEKSGNGQSRLNALREAKKARLDALGLPVDGEYSSSRETSSEKRPVVSPPPNFGKPE